MALVRALPLDQLFRGEMLGLVVGGTRVLLVNVEGGVVAYEDRCAHQGVPLSQGRLAGQVLTCSAHEWEYDVCTGRGQNPKSARLRRLKVVIEEGEILVDVPPPAPTEERRHE